MCVQCRFDSNRCERKRSLTSSYLSLGSANSGNGQAVRWHSDAVEPHVVEERNRSEIVVVDGGI